MKKIKLTMFAFIVILSSLFLLPVKANSDNWIKDNDGYHYYDFSKITGVYSFVVSETGNEILEVKDEWSDGRLWNNTILYEGKQVDFDRIKVDILWASGKYDAFITYYQDGKELRGYTAYHSMDIEGVQRLDFIRKLVDITDIPDDDYVTVDELPATAENPNIYNMLGSVMFYRENNVLIVTIVYYQTYRYKVTFESDTDFTIFEDMIEAYYLNINDRPQIIINNGDKPYLMDILMSEITGKDVPAFVPTTIWDMKSNSLEQTKKYDVSVYLKQNTTGAVVAYVYSDDFVIDNILKARLSFTTREKIKFPWNLTKGNYTEWETTQEEYEHTDFLEYKNKTMTWQDYVPVWNRIRMINKLFKSYSMPRIQKVDLSNIDKNYNVTMNELNRYYKKNNPDFDTIKENSKYNLYAFALYENKSNWVEQTQFYNTENPNDERNFQIIEMLYQTNGKLYTTIGDDMDIDLTPGGPGVDIPDDPNKEPEPSKMPIIILGIIVGLVVIALFKGKEKISLGKLANILLVLGLLAVLTYLAYILIIPLFSVVMLL